MLQVAVFNAHPKHRVAVEKAAAYVKRVLRLGGVEKAKVSVVLIGSKYCRKINKKYLRHDAVTDVISFPLEDGEVLEAEVYVNIDRARSQAREYGVTNENEIARLIIHGTLHLMGHNDKTRGKRALMRKEEERHLRYWFH